MTRLNEHKHHTSEIVHELPANAPHRYLANGTFLFMVYGCAVTERQTPSGMYIYTAVNLKTGRGEILSRRKNQLIESGHAKIAAKIFTSPFCGEGTHTTDKQPGESKGISSLVTTAHHIFKEILPQYGYNLRGNQIGLAEHILEVIGRRSISLAESEVGTGKTHAYLLAALLAKRGRLNDFWLRGHYKNQSWAESAYMPVIISTSSIALQKAIVTDYIPELSRILMEHGVIRTPLTAVIRKGKDHYICEKRLRLYYDSADTQTKKRLDPFIGWRNSNAPFDLTDADILTPYIKKRICVSERCGVGCKYQDKCRYSHYIKKANDTKVDFQITNHNYFLADLLHRSSGKRLLIPNYQLVVIDEAHKFLGAARSIYGLELTDKELPALAREIHAIIQGKSNSGVNVHRFAKRLAEQSAKLFHVMRANIPLDADDETERFPAVMDGYTSRCISNIADIISKLEEAISDSRISKLYEERHSKILWQLRVMNEKISGLLKQSNLIHWFEKRIEGEIKTDALCAIPKDLNERLYKNLWSNGIPIILTSGTLSASRIHGRATSEACDQPGDFTRVKQTLGLDFAPDNKLFTTTMPSPFDFASNKLLYISENVPFPENKDKRYITAVADEVERLVTASHGHAAVLFTSYNAMGQVYAILQKRNLPFPLFRLERGGVHAIERFKKSGNGILFASGALWEGIDIPGDALSMLIIVKLPFAVPDPVGDYEREQCGDIATFKQQVIIPDMQVKLKQGDGRGIRTETDTAVCAILDIRAGKRGAYRDHVISALPKSNITSSIEAVRDFYLDKKPTAYFLSKNQIIGGDSI